MTDTDKAALLELVARVREAQRDAQHGRDIVAWARRWVLMLPDQALDELESIADARLFDYRASPAELAALARYGEIVL